MIQDDGMGVPKSIDGEIVDLTETIRKGMDGKRVFSPELTFDVICDENPLTVKEREILRLAALEGTTKEITSELYLSSVVLMVPVTILLKSSCFLIRWVILFKSCQRD